MALPKRESTFRGSGCRGKEVKSIKDRSKNEINMGRHLGIDFFKILMGFGSQVWVQMAPGSKNRCKKMSKNSENLKGGPGEGLRGPGGVRGRGGDVARGGLQVPNWSFRVRER